MITGLGRICGLLVGLSALLNEEIDQDVDVESTNERNAVEAVEEQAPVRQLELGPDAYEGHNQVEYDQGKNDSRVTHLVQADAEHAADQLRDR